MMSDDNAPTEQTAEQMDKNSILSGTRHPADESSKTLILDDLGAEERKAWMKEGFAGKSSPAASLRSAEDILPQPDDFWVAVMGMTGVGKSTFISALVGDDIGIGHGLNSTTQQLDVYLCKDLFDHRVWLVDTPGFDDTIRSNAEILNEIATFFVKLYDKDIQFSGIIYLHRITDPKMSGTAIKNLELFKLMCGERCFPIVRMVTTRWNELATESPGFQEALKRESQLAESAKFFKPMLDGGSKLMKHENTSQAATKIVVDSLLYPEPQKMALDIQYEMFTRRLRLSQTAAGRFLDQEQSKFRRRYDEELKEIEASMKEAIRLKDEDMLAMLRSEQKEATERRRRLEEDQRNLAATYKQLDARKVREVHPDLVEAGVALRTFSGDDTGLAAPQTQQRYMDSTSSQGARGANSRSLHNPKANEVAPQSPSSHGSSRRHQHSALERGTLRNRRSSISEARKRGSHLLRRLEDWLWPEYQYEVIYRY